ncbi:MAG TPA: MBL fold metallo-hydrolase [Thermoanaerobaculia bacterium]|nr:MBL fold metallo-hydrolase [Thermoanaerobaculia bacterium]
MRIEILIAPNPGPYTLDGTRTYVLGGSVVIDPGPSDPSHIDAILAVAPRPSRIFVTHRHPDHAPGAGPLRERAGADVLGPPGIVPAVDHELRDGESFDLGGVRLEAIATPGHTAEHFCFLSSEGDLFTGDTVLGEGTTTIFPPDGDMAAYLDSLRRLRARSPRRIFPGHGPVRDDAVAWIEGYIEHRLSREREIMRELGERAQAIPELRGRIYPDLTPALHGAAELQIEAHLAKLAAERRAVRDADGWRALRP